MAQRIEESKYIVLQPEDLWNFYTDLKEPGIYRGSGNASNPKLIPSDTRLAKGNDFTIISEQNTKMVIPDRTKGLSFASTIGKLSRDPIISGHVWILPRGVMLPEGLVFNVKDKEHPLLNVSRKMSLPELIEKLKLLSTKLCPAGVKIEKGTGKIIQTKPVEKVENQEKYG